MLLGSIVSNSSILAIIAISWPDGNRYRFSSPTGDQSVSVPDQRSTDSAHCAVRAFIFQQFLIVERAIRLAESPAAAGVARNHNIVDESFHGVTDTIHRRNKTAWLHVRHKEVTAVAPGAEARLLAPAPRRLRVVAIDLSQHRCPGMMVTRLSRDHQAGRCGLIRDA